MTTPLIQLTKINKHYHLGDNDLHVLKDVSITIEEGEFVSIMGPSGSGKSTLINVLGFLDNQFDGGYQFDGADVTQRNDKQISQLRNQMVGFVFQDFNLIPTMSVRENVQLPLLYDGKSARAARQRVDDVIERVGLADYRRHRPNQLSGGQKQRVAIARALVNRPRFIIADEPTGALDTKTSRVIMEILERLNREDGVTVVMVTHDPTLQRYANKHIVMIDGEVQLGEYTDMAALARAFNHDEAEEVAGCD